MKLTEQQQHALNWVLILGGGLGFFFAFCTMTFNYSAHPYTDEKLEQCLEKKRRVEKMFNTCWDYVDSMSYWSYELDGGINLHRGGM
jgi:hypothetical protein